MASENSTQYTKGKGLGISATELYRRRVRQGGAMGYLSRSVFQDRLKRIRAALEEADLVALAVLTPENFLYVSGYFLDVQP